MPAKILPGKMYIGMVFQNYDLFPHMSVIENILLGPLQVQKRPKKEVLEQAQQLLERVGLLNRKDAYPRELSVGQKQRIAIVRALCMNPEIMLWKQPAGLSFCSPTKLTSF